MSTEPEVPPEVELAVRSVLHDLRRRGCSCAHLDIEVVEPAGDDSIRLLVTHSPICHLIASAESLN